MELVIEEYPKARAHDTVFHQAVRDPEMLYCCGKLKWIVVGGDKGQLDGEPHLAAMQLGKTAVFAFTNNHSGPETWAHAFKLAKAKVMSYARSNRRPFMAKIGLDGQVRIYKPGNGGNQKSADARDHESLERAKEYENGRQGKRFVIPERLQQRQGT